MAEVIKMISLNNPTYAYQYCDRWLRTLLSASPSVTTPLTKQSQMYLELDAIQWSLDAVLSKLTGEAL